MRAASNSSVSAGHCRGAGLEDEFYPCLRYSRANSLLHGCLFLERGEILQVSHKSRLCTWKLALDKPEIKLKILHECVSKRTAASGPGPGQYFLELLFDLGSLNVLVDYFSVWSHQQQEGDSHHPHFLGIATVETTCFVELRPG